MRNKSFISIIESIFFGYYRHQLYLTDQTIVELAKGTSSAAILRVLTAIHQVESMKQKDFQSTLVTFGGTLMQSLRADENVSPLQQEPVLSFDEQANENDIEEVAVSEKKSNSIAQEEPKANENVSVVKQSQEQGASRTVNAEARSINSDMVVLESDTLYHGSIASLPSEITDARQKDSCQVEKVKGIKTGKGKMLKRKPS